GGVGRGASRRAGASRDEALPGPRSTTPTTTPIPLPSCADSTPNSPPCGGAFPPVEACAPNNVLSAFECVCLPEGLPACAVAGYPLCGGACADGKVCQALNLQSGGFPTTTCICVDPGRTCGPPPPAACAGAGVCPSGQVCHA